MERAQREIVSVLLEHIFALGLISQITYSKAKDLVYSAKDFPELFRYPIGLTEGECSHECTQNPQ